MINGSACLYAPASSCEPGRTCNPPPPMVIDCPRELVDAPSDPDRDDYRPPNRAGWLRIKEHLRADALGCFFDSDFYCPPTHMDAPCDPGKSEKLQCDPLPSAEKDAGRGSPAANRHEWQIDSFVATRAGNRCMRYPAFVCDGPSCALPEGDSVDCAQ
jgi:hypothetical protein